MDKTSDLGGRDLIRDRKVPARPSVSKGAFAKKREGYRAAGPKVGVSQSGFCLDFDFFGV